MIIYVDIIPHNNDVYQMNTFINLIMPYGQVYVYKKGNTLISRSG